MLARASFHNCASDIAYWRIGIQLTAYSFTGRQLQTRNLKLGTANLALQTAWNNF